MFTLWTKEFTENNLLLQANNGRILQVINTSPDFDFEFESFAFSDSSTKELELFYSSQKPIFYTIE